MIRRSPPRGATLDAVSLLVEAGRVDTAFRDLYLLRARGALADRLPPAEYARLKQLQQEIDRAVGQARAAVLEGDWMRVKQLTAHLTNVRHALDDRRSDLEIAEPVYAGPPLSMDPFSPGLESVPTHIGHGQEVVRDRLLHTLASLQELDPDWAGFYARRGAYFASLVLSTDTVATAGRQVDPLEAQREALRAAERQEFERLAALADAMLSGREHGTDVARRAARVVFATRGRPELAKPFPLETVRRARTLGLAATTLRSYERISAFVSRHAWHASITNGHRGEEQSAPQPSSGVQIRAGVPKPLLDILTQFILHPYVNSAGVRYLPQLLTENVLVEYFPEVPEPPAESPLISSLGLRRRRGLARVEIETALLAHGPQILERELEVDPRDYRLVCIPPDIYTRLGQYCGWGRMPQWTHFDGYQVMRDGRALALVGGDVRYGGVYDLCVVSPTDEREGVIARFAVVRRERLLGGWH